MDSETKVPNLPPDADELMSVARREYPELTGFRHSSGHITAQNEIKQFHHLTYVALRARAEAARKRRVAPNVS